MLLRIRMGGCETVDGFEEAEGLFGKEVANSGRNCWNWFNKFWQWAVEISCGAMRICQFWGSG